MYLKLFWKKQRTIVSTIVSFLHFFLTIKRFIVEIVVLYIYSIL